MKEVGLGATPCGRSSSSVASSEGGTSITDSAEDVFLSNDQLTRAKMAFYINMTNCLKQLTVEMNNQKKLQADALMMQYLDRQTQIEMAKKHFGAK